MPQSLGGGTYRITSLSEGKPPTGVNFTRPAIQDVRLNRPIQVWTLTEVGNDVYRFSVGGYPYTGADGKVIATIYEEQNVNWHITYRESQQAYTIALDKKRHLGWTISHDFSTDSVIQIATIISTPSIPAHFLPGQLFQIERVNNDE